MFGKLKSLFAAKPVVRAVRHDALVAALGDPAAAFVDDDDDFPVHIYAFERDFSSDPDGEDAGYVLVTSGMSAREMHVPAEAAKDHTKTVELIWYVRDLNPEFIGTLRWLAKLADFDKTWFASGHRVPMPDPPLSFCSFKTFLFLSPVIATDATLFSGVASDGPGIETLCVHMISEAEYTMVKPGDDGLNTFLDMLDEHDYPPIFDPKRQSFI